MLALAELAKPWPIALIVDHLIANREAPFDVDAGATCSAIGALILAIAVAESAAQYFTDLWLQSSGEKIAHQLRVAIYDHLQRLSLAYHQRTPKGDLLTRVTEDVNDMGELFSDTLGEMLQSALLSLGMTIVLLWIDPVLALLSLITAPLLVLVSFVFRRRVRDRARKQRRHEGDLASIANEALSAMTVVKAFGAEEHGVRARALRAARSGWAWASRSRGCRPASTAPSASCARSPRRSSPSSASCAWPRATMTRRRPDHLRQLHPQGVEPDAQLRPRGGQAHRRAGARRPDRRGARPRTTSSRTAHLPRPARPRRDRARARLFAYAGERPRSTTSRSRSRPASGSR